MIGKAAKTEKILVAAAAIFLCFVIGVYQQDGKAGGGPCTVETQYQAAASEIIPSSAKKININNASVQQLEELPGIGEALAQRIIDYRKAHGKFSRIEEIQNVNGIGEGKFSDFKDQITVGEETR